MAIERVFLDETGETYEWDAANERAVEKLLKNPDKSLAFWRRGLQRTSFPRIRTVRELVVNWNHCATEEQRPSGGRPSLSREATDAEIRQQTSKLPVDENGDYVL